MTRKKTNYNLLFAGFLVDDDTFHRVSEKETHPQHAAHRYQKSIIQMLIRAQPESLSILGSAPCSTYPKNSALFISSKKWFFEQVPGFVIPSINLPFFRSLSRFIYFFSYVIRWYLSGNGNHNKRKIILLYALHTPHFLPIYFLKRFLNIRIIVFVPDLPIYMNTGAPLTFLKSLLKHLDSKLLLRMANRVDGRIVITDKMLDYFKRDRSLVIDSISLNKRKPIHSYDKASSTYNVIYAGGLNDSYGIRELITCFLHPDIKSTKLKLILCGQGNLANWCTEMSNEHDNIFYYGILNNVEVVALQRSAFALINLRSNRAAYTKYSFPSKIAEYMESGVPIITTRLLGIPDDIWKYLNFVDRDPVETLLDVYNDYITAKLKAEEGRDYFMESRSPENQAERLNKFIFTSYGG